MARRLLSDLKLAQQKCPALCKGELGHMARGFQAELHRAEAFLTLRLKFKQQVDPWIREKRAKKRPRPMPGS